MWVSWSNLVNNSEQWVCAQWSTEHRKTQQSLFKHHQMWFAVTSWNYMSEENIHNSIIYPFLLLANKDITWLFAGRCSWVFFTQRSKPSASITNIKQAEIRERCLTGRINLHKRDKERHDTWSCSSTICYIHLQESKSVSGQHHRDVHGMLSFSGSKKHFMFLFLPLVKVLSCTWFSARALNKASAPNFASSFSTPNTNRRRAH